MVIHDMICGACDEISLDRPYSDKGTLCRCGGVLEVYYGGRSAQNAARISGPDTLALWKHPATGKVLYPGRNDVPMPERYRQQGYERIELRSLREIDSFSRRHNLVNEAAHYDRGSGRSYDDEPGRR